MPSLRTNDSVIHAPSITEDEMRESDPRGEDDDVPAHPETLEYPSDRTVLYFLIILYSCVTRSHSDEHTVTHRLKVNCPYV